jgi:hypothetical protein
MSKTPPTLIKMVVDNSNNLNTFPTATYSYNDNQIYFNRFLDNYGGIEYLFVNQNEKNAKLKQNSQRSSTEKFSVSKLIITRIIHDVNGSGNNDLEMIIEHTPLASNYQKYYLYTCFILTATGSKPNIPESVSFESIFNSLNVNNMAVDSNNICKQNNPNNLSICNPAVDNLKASQKPIQLNNDIIKYQDIKDVSGSTYNATYYLDNSSNAIIVFNPIINIKSSNFSTLQKFINYYIPIPTSKIFSNTDFTPNGKMYSSSFMFDSTTTMESFETLREGMQSFREGARNMSCKPSNTTDINTVTVKNFNQSSSDTQTLLLITNFFVFGVAFVTMFFLSTVWFTSFLFMLCPNFINVKSIDIAFGYYRWIIILSFIIFVGGGICAIVCPRYAGKGVKDSTIQICSLIGIVVISMYFFYKLFINFRKDSIINIIQHKFNSIAPEEVTQQVDYNWTFALPMIETSTTKGST